MYTYVMVILSVFNLCDTRLLILRDRMMVANQQIYTAAAVYPIVAFNWIRLKMTN